MKRNKVYSSPLKSLQLMLSPNSNSSSIEVAKPPPLSRLAGVALCHYQLVICRRQCQAPGKGGYYGDTIVFEMEMIHYTL